jgi:hypothetical protein
VPRRRPITHHHPSRPSASNPSALQGLGTLELRVSVCRCEGCGCAWVGAGSKTLARLPLREIDLAAVSGGWKIQRVASSDRASRCLRSVIHVPIIGAMEKEGDGVVSSASCSKATFAPKQPRRPKACVLADQLTQMAKLGRSALVLSEANACHVICWLIDVL